MPRSVKKGPFIDAHLEAKVEAANKSRATSTKTPDSRAGQVRPGGPRTVDDGRSR